MDLEQALAALRAASQAAENGDESAASDARQLARIVQQLQAQPQSESPTGPLAQVNAGIADTIGGLVDFVNPFDNEYWGRVAGGRFQTGSAAEGLTQAMEAANIPVSREDPEGFGQGFWRGTGQAAGAIIPTAAASRALAGAPVVGQFFDDMATGLSTPSGIAAELAAGGVSQGAADEAESRGAPVWLQNSLAVAAPMAALPAIPAAARVASSVMPTMVGARAIRNRLNAAFAPYTESGANAVARNHLQGLAGGPERAQELGRRIQTDPANNPFGLSPAQQTGDPNMLAIERLAADQSPILRERLEGQVSRSTQALTDALSEQGGDFADTRRFFEQNRRTFGETLAERVRQIGEAAQGRLEKLGPRRAESDNGAQMVEELRIARDEQLQEERRLWESVPRGAQVPTANARATAERLLAETARAQQGDIPRVLRDTLTGDNAFSEFETVNEMHGLYSEMRRLARVYRAGQAPNANAARIADAVAEAILQDMGALDASTAIGRQINEARAFSAALHETFDRGAVGRLLRRTVDGDAATDPEVAMGRTIGRQGATAAVASRQIEAAAPSARPFIMDYIQRRFTESAISPTGEFTGAQAHRFIRDNQELLQRYPELREDILGAVGKQEAADLLADRVQQRMQEVSGRGNAAAEFVSGTQQAAVRSILDAQNPQQAARRIFLEARGDSTGQALAGVKGVFVDDLISRAMRVDGGQNVLSGDRLVAALSDGRYRMALRQLFSNEEIERIEQIAQVATSLNAAQGGLPSVGTSLSGTESNQFIEYAVRILGARVGASMGNDAGTSLQAAQMGSQRARDIMRGLTRDRAAQLIADAVEDPELFRALLMDPDSVSFEARALPRILPYLTGTVAAVSADENGEPR